MDFSIHWSVIAIIEKITPLQLLFSGRFSNSSSACFDFENFSLLTALFFSIHTISAVSFENFTYLELLKPLIFSISPVTDRYL